MRDASLITLLILLVVACFRSGVGQEPQRQDKGLATVYIYRFDEDAIVTNFYFWFLKRSVSFGPAPVAGAKPKYRKIADLRNKDYFIMRLVPGKYIFKTRLMYGHLEIDLTAGGEYYLWVDQGNDCPDDHPNSFGSSGCDDRTPSVVNVPSERWAQHRSVLKPIKSKQAKDHSLVVIPPGP